MRGYVRVVFGLNTLYQLVVGCIALFAPIMMLSIYGASETDQTVLLLQASMRGLGFGILFGGVISALIARDPDQYPVLLPLMAVLSILTLVAWSLTLVTGQMNVGQVGIDMVVQVLLLVGALGYYSKLKK